MVSEDAQFNANLQQLRSVTQRLASHVAHLTHAPATGDAPCNSDLSRSYSQIDAQLGGFHSQLASINEKLADATLSVAVLALAKSGKSTLLNALIGHDMLPSNNVPETARIVRILHDPSAPSPVLQETANGAPQQQRTVGSLAIRTRLQQLNQAHRASSQTSDDLELAITTRIVGLLGEGDASPVKLELIDTPGPNEAGEQALRQQVVRLLGSSADAVIYVLDYTKLKTAEEVDLIKTTEYLHKSVHMLSIAQADVLATLKAENPQLVQRLSSRLFFVVNKFDVQYTEVGLSDEDTRTYVADLITQHMAMPEFQLHPHQVNTRRTVALCW